MTSLSATARDEGVQFTGRFEDAAGEHPFSIGLQGATSVPDELARGNAMLCLGLTPAMMRGVDLHIDAPVSRLLLHRSEEIRDIYRRWYPDRAGRIEVTATEAVEDELARNACSASFFTGGVDSLFTLRERGGVDAIIYVQGYELTHGDTRRIDPARRSASSAAEMTGRRFIEATTDVRSYLDRYTNWLTEANAAALAAVGHLLAGEVGTVVVSSANSHERLFPLGCDPLVDPLWGSSAMRVETFGSHRDRSQKIEAIADWEVARETLRVCGEPDFETANCGRCEKCVRTYMGLVAAGAVGDYARRFEHRPTLEELRALEIPLSRATSWFDWEALSRSLDGRELDGAQAALKAVVEERLYRRSRLLLNNKLRPHVDEVVGSAHWRARWPKFRRKVLRSVSESDPEWLESRVRKHLPELRDAMLKHLAADPAWLRKKLRRARRRRLLQRLHLSRR